MGHVHIIRDFSSPPESSRRTLRIYTPSGYDEQPDRRFPVLYMQDGQNVFEHPESAIYNTWRTNVVMEQLAAAGQIEPWIIVGVDHTVDRFHEYSPWDEPRANARGRGEQYAQFLVRHLKPLVDRTYRTRPEPEWTANMGSSLGGLIALYLGLAHGQVFGRIGAVSPSVMWSQGKMFEAWNRHLRQWTRLYLDAGAEEYFVVDGLEMDYGSAVRNFFYHLKSLGYADHELCFVLEPGGKHSEVDWNRRLPSAMAWLLR